MARPMSKRELERREAEIQARIQASVAARSRPYAAENRLEKYQPQIPLREGFHRSQALKRAIQAPNQVGKTWMACAEDWYHLLGESPYKGELLGGRRGTVGLIVTATTIGTRAVSRALWDLCPVDAVDWTQTEYDDSAKEWVGGRIVMKNGNVAFFVASSQKMTSLSGETVDWMHIDEPPSEKTFGELVMRTVARMAPVWLSFTPIADQDLTWLERLLVGDPDKGLPPEQPDWELYVLTLTQEDCPWLSEAQIEHYHATCPAHEKAQRLYGQFRGLAPLRVFSAFREEHIIDPPTDLSGYELALGVDHGEGAGHQVALLVAWSYEREEVIFLHEYVNERHTTTDEDAEGIEGMFADFEVTPEQVEFAVGDVNTAGKDKPGKRINDLLQARLGIRFVTPDKGAGSVAATNQRFNDALAAGKVRFTRFCSGLTGCMRYWSGRKDRWKHYRDAGLYIATRLFDRLGIAVATSGWKYSGVKSGRRGRGRKGGRRR